MTNGSTGSAYIAGFFSFVFIKVAFCSPCLVAELASKRPVSCANFLLVLCAGMTAVYPDVRLGVALGSVAGVCPPNVPPEELVR